MYPGFRLPVKAAVPGVPVPTRVRRGPAPGHTQRMATKRKLVKTGFDEQIAELVGKTDHRALAIWACDCAERVLPYFEKERPADDRPRLAIDAGRTWAATGVFKMADVRRASLGAHAAAREREGSDAAQAAARAAGQAIATAHVPGHAVAAAIYAAAAVRDGVTATDVDAAVRGERDWQCRHLLELGMARSGDAASA
jgi:hypothetical protein